MTIVFSNFIKLNEDEAFPKFTLLARKSAKVKVWIKGKESHIYKVKDVQKMKGELTRILLTVFSEGEEDKPFIDNKVFIGFSIKDVDYFSEGTVSVNDEDQELIVSIEGNTYRSEKRANERLLTFPHHQVYSYFKIDNKEDENVIQLNKTEDKEYINYKAKQKEDQLKDLSKHVDDISNLVGFRAMDLSSGGVAFTIASEYKGFFDANNTFSFYLMFNGEVFNVVHAKLIYVVDFVSRGSNNARYKVGLNFNPIVELSQQIEKILTSSNGIDAIQKEFEDFVDS
ncbi:hypothetical protein OAT67_05540 [Bacteriovoracaceae bacterium]|nr:hypothetical protein [Bacteriovoracaceae bacterium]